MSPAAEGVDTLEVENHLLAAAGAILPEGRRVSLVPGQKLDLAGDVIWFPEAAVVRLEVGSPPTLGGWIGSEGAVGLAEVLAEDCTDRLAIVEVGGEAWAVSRASALALLSQSAPYNAAVMAWLARSLAEAGRAAVRAARDNARDRVLALIETLDRLHGAGSGFPMSQAEVARLTGIQRTTVCGAVVRLKREKRIVHTRARFRLLR